MRNLKSLILMAVMLAAFGLSAAVPWVATGPKRQVVTLVVTGNYKSSRLMAELIQNESRQPYLLLPAAESDDTRIYYCPPKSNSIEIREDKLNDFVRYINPRRILVLGDSSYVQTKYLDQFDRTIPLVQVYSVDWNRTADEVADMLALTNLGTDYKRLRENLLNKGSIYRPISAPVAPDAPAVEPTAAIDDKAAPVSDEVIVDIKK